MDYFSSYDVKGQTEQLYDLFEYSPGTKKDKQAFLKTKGITISRTSYNKMWWALRDSLSLSSIMELTFEYLLENLNERLYTILTANLNGEYDELHPNDIKVLSYLFHNKGTTRKLGDLLIRYIEEKKITIKVKKQKKTIGTRLLFNKILKSSEDLQYDVAFSFLSRDECIVYEINELLQDHIKTFIYSKNEDQVVTTDGEETFSQVFGSDATIVVVLYREDWGKTPWTRIEQTAIKNRAYDKGYDFLILIPLVSKINIPMWIPKTYIWFDFNRGGVEGAKRIIERKLQMKGGNYLEETPIKKAQHLKRKLQYQEKRNKFLYGGGQGVTAANKEISDLYQEFKVIIEQMGQHELVIDIEKNNKGNKIFLSFKSFKMHCHWICQYVNTIEPSFLIIKMEYHESFGVRNGLFKRKSQIIEELRFKFDLGENDMCGWRKENTDTIIPTKQLAFELMKRYLEIIEENS